MTWNATFGMFQNKKNKAQRTFAIEEVAEVGLCAYELCFDDFW